MVEKKSQLDRLEEKRDKLMLKLKKIDARIVMKGGKSHVNFA